MPVHLPVGTAPARRLGPATCSARICRTTSTVGPPITLITSSTARSAFFSSSTSGISNCPSFASQSANCRLLAVDPRPRSCTVASSRWLLLSVDYPTNTTVGQGVATESPLRLGHPLPSSSQCLSSDALPDFSSLDLDGFTLPRLEWMNVCRGNR